MHILLIFLDGIGLGADDPTCNPFAAAHLPTLKSLAGGQRWLRATPRCEGDRSIFLPTDPRLGVPGRPQSATGQAAIFTGQNVPLLIGEHYGPRPTDAIRRTISEFNLFRRLREAGHRGAFLDAYPPGFFEAVRSGKRLLSSIQFAVHDAGLPIPDADDLLAGRAFSADFTGQGWRDFLGYADLTIDTPEQAGARLAERAREADFALFSTWVTDEIGHRGPLERGVAFLEQFDRVMAGLLDAWNDNEGLIVITSDHGNLEDLSIRQHTENDVPTVVIGGARHTFAQGFGALTDIASRVLQLLGPSTTHGSRAANDQP